MADVTAAAVKELRDKTDAGIMDCKKALAESQGNIEKAIDWLRKNGLSKAAKKTSRIATQGLVSLITKGTLGAMIEVNSETDFVARNEQFSSFVKAITPQVLETGENLDALKNTLYPNSSKTIAEAQTELIATIGENINIRRAQKLQVDRGFIASYMHGAISPNLGTIGILIGFESDQKETELEAIAKQLAMHIAASNPVCIDIESVDPTLIEREKNVQRDQAKTSGKPTDVIEKMVDGRIRKYYEEIVLLEQAFIMDPSKKVKTALQEAGFQGRIKNFLRFSLGEGLEKKESDSATEVASMVKS